MGKVITLDAGHGGYDSGATANGIQEKDANLALTLRIAADLTMLNPSNRIIFTRTADKTVALRDRAVISDMYKSDLFVSIHHNAGGGSGFESHVHPSASYIARHLQERIQLAVEQISTDFGIAVRRAKQSNFQVLRDTDAPAILLETLFVDNIVDSKWIMNPNWQHTFSYTIAQVINNA